MKDIKTSLVSLGDKIVRIGKPYALIAFVLMFALVYAFLVLRINSLSNAPVDDNAVTSQVQASPSLRIDSQAVNQLESLKDNSVSVQALFEEQRTNPF